MLTYHMENRGHLPLYEYLYYCIKEDIVNNILKQGEKLPSKRSLAKHLDISVVTVETAYAQLQIEGYIYSREKSGFFVADVQELLPEELPFAAAATSHASKKTAACSPALARDTAARNPEFQCMENKADTEHPNWFADFQTNNISEESFPFSVWSKLCREVLADKDPDLLKSQPSNGAIRLRSAICEFLYHFRGMTVAPEQVVIGAGTEYLYSLLIQLIGREQTYAVEDPGYRKVAEILTSNGAHCEYIPLDEYGLSCQALQENKASVLHISPAHHFPTGIIMPITRRQELLRWAYRRPDRYIIEDDYDSEFRFQGRPIQTMQSIDQQGRVIYINTFSKSLTPSIRISYMVLPHSLAARCRQELSFYSCTVSSFEQYTLAAFISRGYYEQHLNRTRNTYRAKRNLVIRALHESSLAPISEIQEENSGLHFLLEVHTTLTDDQMISAAANRGIKINCLSKYYHLKNDMREHVFILNYSGMDNARIPDAIRRLASIFELEQ